MARLYSLVNEMLILAASPYRLYSDGGAEDDSAVFLTFSELDALPRRATRGWGR